MGRCCLTGMLAAMGGALLALGGCSAAQPNTQLESGVERNVPAGPVLEKDVQLVSAPSMDGDSSTDVQTGQPPFLALPRDILVMSRRYKMTRSLLLGSDEAQLLIAGSRQLDERNHAFMALIGYLFLDVDRLTGLTLRQVEQIFGPGIADDSAPDAIDRYFWDGAGHYLVIDFRDDRAVMVVYLVDL